MTSTSTAASALFETLLAEASAWACDDAEDQQVLQAVEAASTPGDKLDLLRNSTLVPSQLSEAIADALIALDHVTYAPPRPGAGQEMRRLTAPVMARIAAVTMSGSRPTPQARRPEASAIST